MYTHFYIFVYTLVHILFLFCAYISPVLMWANRLVYRNDIACLCMFFGFFGGGVARKPRICTQGTLRKCQICIVETRFRLTCARFIFACIYGRFSPPPNQDIRAIQNNPVHDYMCTLNFLQRGLKTFILFEYMRLLFIYMMYIFEIV